MSLRIWGIWVLGFAFTGVAFQLLGVGFGSPGFYFTLWMSILGLWESILGMWQIIFGPLGLDFGPLRVNIGYLEVVFRPVKGEFLHCVSNLGPLARSRFLCLYVKLKTLGIIISPLIVDLRPFRVYFRPLGIYFWLEKLILDLSLMTLGSGGNVFQIWRVRPLRVNFRSVGLYFWTRKTDFGALKGSVIRFGLWRITFI